MRSTVLLAAAACLGAALAMNAQGPAVPRSPAPQPSSSPVRDVQQSLVAQGCVNGTRFTIDPDNPVNQAAKMFRAKEFVLEGEKELMQQLKTQHDGHEDEIRGIVFLPAGQDRDTLTTTRKVGPKTTVSAGARQQTEDDPLEGWRRLRLKVLQLEHRNDRCYAVQNSGRSR